MRSGTTYLNEKKKKNFWQNAEDHFTPAVPAGDRAPVERMRRNDHNDGQAGRQHELGLDEACRIPAKESLAGALRWDWPAQDKVPSTERVAVKTTQGEEGHSTRVPVLLE